jgi:uncharacterized repeat protein (TIGR03803 family)
MGKLNWAKKAYAVCLLCATTAIALSAQTLTTLQSFNSTNGAFPAAALVQASDGNLYGTTSGGGAFGEYVGTVFEIAPTGTLTTLHSFCSEVNCTDGFQPEAPLVQAIDGDLYGTTAAGGAYGRGTVFKITPGGTLTTLYSFGAQSGDGVAPYAGLVQATDGNFYGTTLLGGANYAGTVFKITPRGKLTTLYSFCSQSGCTDGQYTYGALVQGTDGDFYGTTQYDGVYGGGTVFKMTYSGTLTTLYSFGSQDGDGANPIVGLLQAANGDFYGTTVYGGANGYGTVFKITPSGALTTLHSFDYTDGEYASAALVQATDGNFYGTTEAGGANSVCIDGCGTVFKITPSGTLTTVHSFDMTDGAYPLAAVLQDTGGKLYGTTFDGGVVATCSIGCGTVFSLSVGLGPFVVTQPTSGKVGAAVKILGTNLTGATSVTFNGTPATFTVTSGSEITTTVPTGATTGKVKVTISGHTLSSNVNFRVAP